MRMWMINSKLLCDKHLLGEHGEIHKHRHCFEKQYSIAGRISPIVQIEPANMANRHDQLVQEMLSRGMNHRSPYVQPDIRYLPIEYQNAQVDIWQSINDLVERCSVCAERIIKMLENMD